LEWEIDLQCLQVRQRRCFNIADLTQRWRDAGRIKVLDSLLSDYDWRKGLILVAILIAAFGIDDFVSRRIDSAHGLIFGSLSAVSLIVLYVRRDAISLKLVSALGVILILELAGSLALPLPKHIPGFSVMPVCFGDLFLLLWIVSKFKPES